MDRIDRYLVEGELGRGGVGVVLRARDLELERPVAIKLLLADDERLRVRLRREGQALARLRHPHVVPIHGAGEWRGRPYLVMDLVEGESLQARLDREGPLPWREVVALGLALADALAAVHAQGLLHRDLKPSNVLVDRDGRALLTDFGLVKDLEPGDATQQLTRSGMLFGTPGFLAPEQAQGRAHQAGPTLDVYGLGATLYASLTGRPPIEGRTLPEVLAATLEQVPLAPSRLLSGVPPALDAALLTCLAKAPGDRFVSMAALAEELRGCEAAPGGRARWVLVGAAGLAAASLTAGGLALARGPAAATRSAAPPSQPDAPAPSTDAPRRAPPRRAVPPREPHPPSALAAGGPIAVTVPADARNPPELERLAELARAREAQEGAKAAFPTWERAAKAGHLGAMVRVGQLLSQSDEVPRNDLGAAGWFGLAAEAGDSQAMSELGFMLMEGRGVARDAAAAARWFERSARAGNPEGMSNYGYVLRSGAGVPADPAAGMEWTRRAAEVGHPAAMRNLGMALLEGDDVRPDPARGLEWLEQAAARGDVTAMTWLGFHLAHGTAGPREPQRALQHYLRAGEAGSARALTHAGQMLWAGDGVPRDVPWAVTLLERAVAGGDAYAKVILGQIHEVGEHGSADPARARALFREAADAGELSGMYHLGRTLAGGIGGPRQPGEALRLLRRAAEGGFALAMFELGRLYEGGALGGPDLGEARHWYEAAAAAGFTPARQALEQLGR